MSPLRLEIVAQAAILVALLSAATSVIVLLARPRAMMIMNFVWPITALYWGPVGLWAMLRLDRPKPPAAAAHHAAGYAPATGHATMAHARDKPFWQDVIVAATHCGAGCTLGDILGEWLVFAFGWTLFGDMLYAEYAVDLPLAFLLGIAFQYYSIAPMRGLGFRDGLIAALQADTVAILAFEIGLFGWMAVSDRLLPDMSAASWTHWFMMQLGMIIGFITSYPANWWLIRAGIKERM